MNLREQIIAEMQRYTKEQKDNDQYPEWNRRFEYCTWWFKFRIPCRTVAIRRELERMEHDGLVNADRSQSNNTKWVLTYY